MNESNFQEFFPQLSQKGYTLRESRVISNQNQVPKQFQDRYSTYEEYTDAMHDFLNGL